MTNTKAKDRKPVMVWVVCMFPLVWTICFLSAEMVAMGRQLGGVSVDVLADYEYYNGAQKTTCRLTDMVSSWKEKAKNIAAGFTPMSLPTLARPFVFFHVRKAGGSSIRTFLFNATKRNNLEHWIPCKTPGLHCRNYVMPSTKHYPVYGGHLYYVDVLNTIGFTPITKKNSELQPRQRMDPPSFDCITTLRPTVSRVVSCWNYRMGTQTQYRKGFTPAHNMTQDQWKTELSTTYSIYSEGCNNEIVRVFGSYADESMVNTLTVTGSNRESCAAESELERILQRMSQCLILINDRCEDNQRLVSHFVPWMAPFFDSCGLHENKSKFKSNVLQPGSEQIILEQNRMDNLVYDFGLSLFEAQLEVARQNRSKWKTALKS